MTTPWWSGLAAAELPMDCAGHPHHLRWADGELTAHDHPDAERERMLSALGADPYPCLDILDLWTQHTDDLEVLVQASRGPADPLEANDNGGVLHRHGVTHRGSYASMGSSRPRPGRSVGWYAYAAGTPGPSDERPRGLDELLQLGSGLPERLVATVIGTWTERNEALDSRAVAAAPALKAALYGRFCAAVTGWLGAPMPMQLSVVESGGASALRRADEVLHAEVPLTWLRDVWCRGLTTMLGRLTLAAREVGAGTWELVTVAPDLGPPRTMTLTL